MDGFFNILLVAGLFCDTNAAFIADDLNVVVKAEFVGYR
jgi:hypothetical protein